MGRLSGKRSNTDNVAPLKTTAVPPAAVLSTGIKRDSYSKKIKIDPHFKHQVEPSEKVARDKDEESVSSNEGRNSVEGIQSPHGSYDVETDPAILARRLKQIDYGKTTREYANYIEAIPREDRASFHPKTPNSKRKYSRRAWDGLIKQWRLNLHLWSDAPVSELDFSQNGVIRKRRNDSTSSSNTAESSTAISASAESEKDSILSPSILSPSEVSFKNKDKTKLSADVFSDSWSKQMDDDDELDDD